MKETKFPDKWYIKRDSKNYNDINNYLNDLYFKDSPSYYNNTEGYVYSEIVYIYDEYGAASEDIITGYTEITFQQFKENVLMKKEEKEIAHYTLKDAKFEEAARAVVGHKDKWKVEEPAFCHNSKYYRQYKELGVLDLWFTPVYKEEKHVLLLSCSMGTFALEVSSKGIYYRPDSTYLSVQDLVDIVTPRSGHLNTSSTTIYTYSQVLTHVDLGCKKNVPVDDIKKVLAKYYSLKDK